MNSVCRGSAQYLNQAPNWPLFFHLFVIDRPLTSSPKSLSSHCHLPPKSRCPNFISPLMTAAPLSGARRIIASLW